MRVGSLTGLSYPSDLHKGAKNRYGERRLKAAPGLFVGLEPIPSARENVRAVVLLTMSVPRSDTGAPGLEAQGVLANNLREGIRQTSGVTSG